MIWGKRRFADAEYGPYFDRLEKLMMAQPSRHDQFIMVSTGDDEAGLGDYYVGVPDELSFRAFDGFARIAEAELPKEIDVFHIGNQGSSWEEIV